MKILFDLPFRKASLYVIGGGLSFSLKIVLTMLLTEYIRIPYFSSYLITLSTIVVFSFFYNAYLTFKVEKNKLINFIMYVIVLLTFNFIDAALVRMLTEFFGIYYVFSITSVAIIMFIIKYIIYDRIVFVRRHV